MTPHDRRPRLARLAYLAPLGLLIAACGDSSAPLVPAELAIVGGDQQQVPVGQGAPIPLQVRVQTEGGQAVSGEEVVWAVASGVATVDPDTSGTDANGVATTTVQMGRRRGRSPSPPPSVSFLPRPSSWPRRPGRRPSPRP